MSTTSSLPLFGRKYKLTVKTSPDSSGNSTLIEITNSDWEPEALRITFDIYMSAWQGNYWYADISIYNLDQATAAQIVGNPSFSPNVVTQGMKVILEAGYYNGNFGTIWEGIVIQPLWDRENVVDFKLTLHCAVGLLESTRNFVNNTYAIVGQQDLIKKMLADSYFPVNVDPKRISGDIPNTPSDRPVTVFGNPKRYLDMIAADNNANSWLDDHGFAIATMTSDVMSDADVIVYTPETGIIGVPVQTQDGVSFTLLLDARVAVQKPFMQVKIDNTVIQQEKRIADPSGSQPGLLDPTGTYAVIGVEHIGDTRGQDWYTRVVGMTTAGGKVAVLAAALNKTLNIRQ